MTDWVPRHFLSGFLNSCRRQQEQTKSESKLTIKTATTVVVWLTTMSDLFFIRSPRASGSSRILLPRSNFVGTAFSSSIMRTFLPVFSLISFLLASLLCPVKHESSKCFEQRRSCCCGRHRPSMWLPVLSCRLTLFIHSLNRLGFLSLFGNLWKLNCESAVCSSLQFAAAHSDGIFTS